MIGQIKALDEQESGGYKREGVMEERKLSWGDRRLNPIVRQIPPWIKPNHLSFARVPITLLAVVSLAVGWNAVAVFLLSLAVLFDLLDGPLARHRKEESKTGAWLDPCADKVMIMGILLIFGWGHFPIALIMVTAVLEVLLVFGRWIKIRLGKNVRSNGWGKIKMWFQSAAVIGFAAHAGWTLFVANIALWTALGLAGLSIFFHIRDLWR